MSVSTNAILFYGFMLDEDENGEGLRDQTYLDSKSTCLIDHHCSYEFPIFYLALRAACWEAYRGRSEDFGKTLPVLGDVDSMIQTFCEQMGIRMREPQWHLVSDWS